MTRLPPQNIEAEQSVLGAMMLSRDAIRVCIDRLRSSDFYKPAHGLIFDAIRRLHADGTPVDPVTVAEQLDRDGVLGECGGKSVLLVIQHNTPASSNASTYARIVVDCAVYRGLIRAGTEVAEIGYGGGGDVADSLDRARALLQDIDVPTEGQVDYLDLDAIADRRVDEQFIIPGLIVRKERAILVAPPGQGKTTLCRQFGVQVSQGIHPFRSGTFIEPLRVLQLDGENPPFNVTKAFHTLRNVARIRSRDYDGSRMAVAERARGCNILSRADRSWLLDQIEAHRPDLLVVGPLYKMFDGDPWDGQTARRAQDVFDDIRDRYNCALLIEHHGTHQENRASGSHYWRRWPEFRLALSKSSEYGTYWLKHFDDPRDADRDWPEQVKRGGDWPWSAV